MSELNFKFGWNCFDNNINKHGEPFSKIILNYGHTHSNLILKLKNIKKDNQFKIFKDNELTNVLNVGSDEEFTFKIDIKDCNSLDIISDSYILENNYKTSFELKKIFLDSEKVKIENIPIKNYNSKLKTIINSYSPNFNGGFGDFIRGSIHLYRYCKHNKLNFNIDFKHHEFKQFILNKNESDITYSESEIFDLPKCCGFNPNCMADFLSKNLKNIQNENLILSSYYIDFLHSKNQEDKSIMDHMNDFKLTDEEKYFFQNTFIFSKKIENRYSNWLENNNLEEYSVVHVRLGDSNFIKNDSNELDRKKYCTFLNSNFESVYNKILEFQKSSDYTVVVLSDSNEFKEYIKTKNNPKIIPTSTISSHCVKKPGIFEFTDVKISSKNLRIEDSAFDMKVLSKSKKTKILSVYYWGSGFSAWISKIFNIDCEISRLESTIYKESIDRRDIVPYGYGGWHYQLELNYNPSESILVYMQKLINAFFLAEEYKVFIYGNFPNFLNTKVVNWIKETDRKITESCDFSNLKPFCEQCRIEDKKQLFMNNICSYQNHFCEHINLYKKRSIYRRHIKPMIVDLSSDKKENTLYFIITKEDIKNNLKQILNDIKSEIKIKRYSNYKIISESEDLNDVLNKKIKNKNIEYICLENSIDRIFYSKNMYIFDKNILELIISINDTLQNLHTSIILDIDLTSFGIEIK